MINSTDINDMKPVDILEFINIMGLSGYYLENHKCDKLRRIPVNFNDMLRCAYLVGVNEAMNKQM